MAVNDEMLNSWKEIAVYLGRGVRTVQRWEIDLGLPVRRPRGKPRSAVIALKAELDRWLTGPQKETLSKEIVIKPSIARLQAQSLGSSDHESLVSRTKQVLERSFALSTRSYELCEQLKRSLVVTTKLVKRKPNQPSVIAPVIVEETKAARTNS